MSEFGDGCFWMPKGGRDGWWDVNDGAFLFNATHPAGHRVLDAWHDEAARRRCLGAPQGAPGGDGPERHLGDGDPARRTAVLIAARDLEDEELFLDYKLSAGSPPPWYAPVAAS